MAQSLQPLSNTSNEQKRNTIKHNPSNSQYNNAKQGLNQHTNNKTQHQTTQYNQQLFRDQWV